MYGFENETYLKVLHGAVDNIEVIKDIIEKVEEKGFDKCISCRYWRNIFYGESACIYVEDKLYFGMVL